MSPPPQGVVCYPAFLADSPGSAGALLAALGTIFLGSALVMQEPATTGLPQLIHGIAAYRATGAEAGRHYWLGMLAEAYGKVGQIDEGLTALTEALELVEKNGECYYKAELYRLKGALLLDQTVPDACQAEACFSSPLPLPAVSRPGPASYGRRGVCVACGSARVSVP
jgi:hypothetical protein